MGLIGLVMILCVAGALLYLVNSAPFIDASMKPIIRWVIIAVVVLWLITVFFGDIQLPTLHTMRR